MSSSLTHHSHKTIVYLRTRSWLARCGSWILREPSVALTLGNRIHLHGSSAAAFQANKSWLAHELAHVRQFRRYGLLRFLCMYCWESIRVGYYENRWEVAAREQEADLSILEDFVVL